MIFQVVGVDFNKPEDTLGDKSQVSYVSQGTNLPPKTQSNGVVYYYCVTSDYKRLEYRPNGSNKIFYRRKEAGTWLDWVEVLIVSQI